MSLQHTEEARLERIGANAWRTQQSARIARRKAEEAAWRETYNKPARPVRA